MFSTPKRVCACCTPNVVTLGCCCLRSPASLAESLRPVLLAHRAVANLRRKNCASLTIKLPGLLLLQSSPPAFSCQFVHGLLPPLLFPTCRYDELGEVLARWPSFWACSPPMTIFDPLPALPQPISTPSNPQIECGPLRWGYGVTSHEFLRPLDLGICGGFPGYVLGDKGTLTSKLGSGVHLHHRRQPNVPLPDFFIS